MIDPFNDLISAKRDHKRRVAHAFDATSASYGTSGDFHERFAQRLVEIAELTPGQIVLDVATGTAPAAIAAAQRVGSVGRVIGVDLSLGMLRHAQTNTASMPNLMLCQSDVEMLPFADATFDAVLCSSSVAWFPDIPAAFCDWRRVLKSGGLAVFSCFAHSANTTGRLLRKHLLDYNIALLDLNAPLDTQGKCRAMVRQAGFSKCEIIAEQWGGYMQQDVGQIFRGAWDGNRNRFGFDLNPVQVARLKAAFVADVAAMTTANGFWNDMTAFFVQAFA